MQNYNSNKAIKYRLGLDLGTNSIGFALVAIDSNKNANKIIKTGVRIFSDGRNPKNKEPLSVARRNFRGARRNRDRKICRKKIIINYLISLGLLSQEESERQALKNLCPYILRDKAVREPISKEELARIIINLAQRRGYLSNSKEKSKEDGVVLKAIAKFEQLLKDGKSLGQVLYQLKQEGKRVRSVSLKNESNKDSKKDAKNIDIEDDENANKTKAGNDNKELENIVRIGRASYVKEFEAIKKFQQQNFSLTAEQWQKIHDLLFYQRQLKEQEIGNCRFINKFNNLPDWAKDELAKYSAEQKKIGKREPTGLPRGYLAMPSYCNFALWSQVVNLKLKNGNERYGKTIFLTNKDRNLLFLQLQNKKEITLENFRKTIDFTQKEYVEFGLDRGNSIFHLTKNNQNNEEKEQKKIAGNLTNIELSNEKKYFDFAVKWQELALAEKLAEQDEIVKFLLEADSEKEIYDKAIKDWDCSKEASDAISKIDIGQFKSGVGDLSVAMCRNLFITMKDNHCLYNEAMLCLGFHHSDKKSNVLTTDLAEKLEYYGKAIPASVIGAGKSTASEQDEYGKIANPTVHIALNQIRKVVNELIADFGKPSEINIELARDLKRSKKEKARIETQNSANEKNNKAIKAEFGENCDLMKIKLLQEADFCCVYCSAKTSKTELINGYCSFEVEHILPFSRTFDDSFNNKTIACRRCNQIKGNKTPAELCDGSNEFSLENIRLGLNEKLQKKAWRFLPDAIAKFTKDNSFIARQLNDTRYISRIAREYLATICPENQINIINGATTAMIRKDLQLSQILQELTAKDLSELQRVSKKASIEDEQEGEQEDEQEDGQEEDGSSNGKAVENKADDSKKKRDDHRHHAVDAIVIAMVNNSFLQKFANAVGEIKGSNSSVDLKNLHKEVAKKAPDLTYENFANEVKENLAQLVVSHRVSHRLNAELFDSGGHYGILAKKEPGVGNKIKEKGFGAITFADIEKIAVEDIEIANFLTDFFEKNPDLKTEDKLDGLAKNKAKKALVKKALAEKFPDLEKIRYYQNALKNLRGKGKLEADKTAVIISHGKDLEHRKAILPASNFAISLWEIPPHLGKEKSYHTIVSSNAELMSCYPLVKDQTTGLRYFDKSKKGKVLSEYSKNKAEIMAKIKPHPSAKLVIMLSGGDSIKLIHQQREIVARITIICASNNQVKYLHNSNENIEGSFVLNKKAIDEKKIKKIAVSPIGKVFGVA